MQDLSHLLYLPCVLSSSKDNKTEVMASVHVFMWMCEL